MDEPVEAQKSFSVDLYHIAPMSRPSLYHTFQRYRTLQTNRISALPVVILMPHSACNCRCVMCDIWKDNHHVKQLTEADVQPLIGALHKFGTQQVVMSGGEALLNRAFFRLCAMLQEAGMQISLLTTGLAMKQHITQILTRIDDVIVSLDGDEETHDRIRNIPGAFRKLKEGIDLLKSADAGFPVRARSVIHRLNFRKWQQLVDAA